MDTRPYSQRTDIHGPKQRTKIPKAAQYMKKKMGKTEKLRCLYSLRLVCKITALCDIPLKMLFEMRIYLPVK